MANVDVYAHQNRIGRLQNEGLHHYYSYKLNTKFVLSLTMLIRLDWIYILVMGYILFSNEYARRREGLIN